MTDNVNTKRPDLLGNKLARKHGHASQSGVSSTYIRWRSMIARCTNPNCAGYSRYGGRGIRIDPKWMEFGAFLADMGEAPDGMTLDRIDNDGHYEPGNCRWATPQQQALNRCNTVRVSVNGESLTVNQWAERLGCDRTTIHYRLRHGWSPEAAVTTPPDRRNRRAS